jgi:hypothetical protein
MRLRLIAAAGLLLSSAAGLCAAIASPTQLNLSASQMFALADQATDKGDTQTAEAIYRAMFVDASPDIRIEARFRLAMLESKRGNLSQAAVLLREVVDARPSASRARLELAGVLDRMGDKDGAWRQIRAVQAGGLPPAVARLVDRYSEALRAQRPFGASFEIALAPDSNINHATSSDKLGTVLGDFDIGSESKARSGTGVSFQGQAYRRFSVGNVGRDLLVRLSGLGNLYGKSRFNDLVLDLGAGPELQIGSNRVNLEAGASQRWYGQKSYMRSVRLGLAAARPIGRMSQLRFVGTATLVDNRINDLEDG